MNSSSLARRPWSKITFFVGILFPAILFTSCNQTSAPETARLNAGKAGTSFADYEKEYGWQFQYDVAFTNPICAEYSYPSEVLSNSGKRLNSKPRNAYCKNSDAKVNAANPDGALSRMRRWIQDPSTTEIFLATLTFSNTSIRYDLCQAIEERSVKVTMVLDSQTSQKQADLLRACQPKDGKSFPTVVTRGGAGGLGYAHNKLVIFNPNSDVVRIVFASGNLTSGLVLHHENWNFITLPAKTHFAEAHRCLMTGMLDHGDALDTYAQYITDCKKSISYPEEGDIKVYFVPGEGDKALEEIRQGLADSYRVDLAAHRFSLWELIDGLVDFQTGKVPGAVRVLFDDDVHWNGLGQKVGLNTASEAAHAQRVIDAGAGGRYLETNHGGLLLHHNKFIIFHGNNSKVFTGAGNFTKSAFVQNFENYYVISNSKIVEKYKTQYNHLFGDLASTVDYMPAENILP